MSARVMPADDPGGTSGQPVSIRKALAAATAGGYRILVVNGPNLATLGTREPEVYGAAGLDEIEAMLRVRAGELGVELRFVQSNHEGVLVDALEEERDRADGCILNPAGLSHTSVVLLDAIRSFARPVIEVHISNIHAREPYRRQSLTGEAARGVITGLGLTGYLLALEGMVRLLGETGAPADPA